MDEALPVILETGSYESVRKRPLNESSDPSIMLNSYDFEKLMYLFYLEQYNALKFGKSEKLRDCAMSHCNAFGVVILFM